VRIRTADLLITSELLYLLSYAGILENNIRLFTQKVDKNGRQVRARSKGGPLAGGAPHKQHLQKADLFWDYYFPFFPFPFP
jgi:hypothetical protein